MVYRSKIYMSNKKAHCLLLNRTHLESHANWGPTKTRILQIGCFLGSQHSRVGRVEAWCRWFFTSGPSRWCGSARGNQGGGSNFAKWPAFPTEAPESHLCSGGPQGRCCETCKASLVKPCSRKTPQDLLKRYHPDSMARLVRRTNKAGLKDPETGVIRSLSKSVKPCKDVSLRGSAWSGGSISGWISQMTQCFSKCVHWICLPLIWMHWLYWFDLLMLSIADGRVVGNVAVCETWEGMSIEPQVCRYDRYDRMRIVIPSCWKMVSKTGCQPASLNPWCFKVFNVNATSTRVETGTRYLYWMERSILHSEYLPLKIQSVLDIAIHWHFLLLWLAEQLIPAPISAWWHLQ